MPSKQQSCKQKAHTIDDDVKEGRVGDTQEWFFKNILDYRMTHNCFDRRLGGLREVRFAIEWEGEVYKNEQTLEPLTNLIHIKDEVRSFLEKQGLELVVNLSTKESWVVDRPPSPPDSSELSSDNETNLDPSAGLEGPTNFFFHESAVQVSVTAMAD